MKKKIKRNTTRPSSDIPEMLYPAICLQAIGNNMSPDQYVRMLQDNLNLIYSTDDVDSIASGEGKDHVLSVRAVFPTKPDVYSYFVWMIRAAEQRTA